jgi:hypothetical protein
VTHLAVSRLLLLQERVTAERRIQHLEAAGSSTRQELNAARLAGIADRQRDDRQISTLKAQVQKLRFHPSDVPRLPPSICEESADLVLSLSGRWLEESKMVDVALALTAGDAECTAMTLAS